MRRVKINGYEKIVSGGQTGTSFQVDHIVPQSWDVADHSGANLQPLCRRCNLLKGDTEDIDYRTGDVDEVRATVEVVRTSWGKMDWVRNRRQRSLAAKSGHGGASAIGIA